MVVRIPLTRGLFATVDDLDAHVVGGHKWQAFRTGAIWYATRQIDGRQVGMHRFLLAPPEGLTVDHIDGDGLNNTRANLRIATRAQNSANKRKLVTRGCRFKGVFKGKYGFNASIRWKPVFPNGPFRIGVFSTEADAAKAYDACARILHGEFARLNFPRRGEQPAHEPPPPPERPSIIRARIVARVLEDASNGFSARAIIDRIGNGLTKQAVTGIAWRRGYRLGCKSDGLEERRRLERKARQEEQRQRRARSHYGITASSLSSCSVDPEFEERA